MKKENGIYADFYVYKDGMEFPIRTLHMKDVSRLLTDGLMNGLENVVNPSTESGGNDDNT